MLGKMCRSSAPCLPVFLLVCVLCRPVCWTSLHPFEIFLLACYFSPPTHLTRAPPTPVASNSRLAILNATEQAKELCDEFQSPRCTFAISIVIAKLHVWNAKLSLFMVKDYKHAVLIIAAAPPYSVTIAT